jgi:hypothetical protein
VPTVDAPRAGVRGRSQVALDVRRGRRGPDPRERANVSNDVNELDFDARHGSSGVRHLAGSLRAKTS